MYTKEQLIAAMRNEFRIIKHLAEKIPADTEGYKPTEKQRTTLELLQYLSIIFVAFTDEELAVVINLYGMGDKPKATYLVECLLKWAAAYKMQLFLYIKSSGNSSIGTSNLWGGMDMPAA